MWRLHGQDTEARGRGMAVRATFGSRTLARSLAPIAGGGYWEDQGYEWYAGILDMAAMAEVRRRQFGMMGRREFGRMTPRQYGAPLSPSIVVT
jgi:hypothetical protein